LWPFSRFAAYGSDFSADGTTPVEDPDEQAILGEIVAMRSRGMSLGKIAQALNERDIPTKRRIGRWRRQSIAAILRRHTNNGGTRA